MSEFPPNPPPQQPPQQPQPQKPQSSPGSTFVPLSYPPVPHRIVIARRAGWLMIALGILLVLGGGCMSLVGKALPSVIKQVPPETLENLHQMEQQSHLPIQTMMYMTASILLAGAIFQIVMGIFVYRGGRRSILIAVVVTAALAAIWTLNLLIELGTGYPSNVAGSAGFLLIMVCLIAWQLSWLFQALHAAGNTTDPIPFTAAYTQIPTAIPGNFIYPPSPPDPSPIGWPYPPPPPNSGGERSSD